MVLAQISACCSLVIITAIAVASLCSVCLHYCETLVNVTCYMIDMLTDGGVRIMCVKLYVLSEYCIALVELIRKKLAAD